MSGITPTDISADESTAAAQTKLDHVGVVKKVYPHTQKGDQRTGGVDVKLVTTGTKLENIPVAAGFHGETRLPQKGQSVIIRWLKSNPPMPYVAQASVLG